MAKSFNSLGRVFGTVKGTVITYRNAKGQVQRHTVAGEHLVPSQVQMEMLKLHVGRSAILGHKHTGA